MSGVVEDAIEERFERGHTGRWKAFVAAAAVGIAAAALTYKLLRAG
jgi:hypothetical protein